MTHLIDIPRKLLAGFTIVFSTLLISMVRVERNPQNCEMISVQLKKKKEL